MGDLTGKLQIRAGVIDRAVGGSLHLDDAQRYALEASGFLLERRGAGYTAYSDAAGNPPMRIPVFNNAPYRAGGFGMVVAPQEDGVPVALPGDITGRASFQSSLQFWGAEAGGSVALFRSRSLEISGLAAARYLNLAERFNLRLDISGQPNSLFAGQGGFSIDDFKTENQFFGGTLGVRASYGIGRFSAEGTTRLGIGLSHETEAISGNFRKTNTPALRGAPDAVAGLLPLSAGPNGIFAQPSNAGRRSVDRFAVVPEVGVKLGYDLTSWARLTAGYDFIYYSSVLRPTDQIDRSFSKGLPFLQDPQSQIGPTRRARSTDFYAHGLSLGVAVRF
ncbi:MAG: hypothetical protein NVS2B11_12920 [Acetobacteraceae bacterium]